MKRWPKDDGPFYECWLSNSSEACNWMVGHFFETVLAQRPHHPIIQTQIVLDLFSECSHRFGHPQHFQTSKAETLLALVWSINQFAKTILRPWDHEPLVATKSKLAQPNSKEDVNNLQLALNMDLFEGEEAKSCKWLGERPRFPDRLPYSSQMCSSFCKFPFSQ